MKPDAQFYAFQAVVAPYGTNKKLLGCWVVEFEIVQPDNSSTQQPNNSSTQQPNNSIFVIFTSWKFSTLDF